MQSGEPILLICHSFPPNFGIGGRRWAKFAKELARRGHPVHVIRSEQLPGTPDSLWSGDAATPGIAHHPLPRRYPAILMQPEMRSFWDKLRYHGWMYLLPLFCKGNWYDYAFFWRKQLLRKASAVIREQGIRQVITTGAPFRLMVYALALKDTFPGLKFTMDFRDEWTWMRYYGFDVLKPGPANFERQLEAQVIRQADRIISPHAAILKHLQTAHRADAAKFAMIPHAVDPEDFDRSVQPAADGSFKMIYAGSLYRAGEAKEYFIQLLKALTELRHQQRAAFEACRLDLYITGQHTDAFQAMVREQGLSERVRFHAPLKPREIMRRISESNLVLTFIPAEKKDIMVTKLNEVFYLGTPLLHVGEPGVVSRTIQARRMGDSIRVEELVAELPRIIAGARKVACDTNADHSAYLLPKVTDRLLNEALA